MRFGRAFRQALIARLDASVPALAGRVYDKAPDGVGVPYCTLGPSDFSDRSPTCLGLLPYAIQIDLWDRDSSKGRMEDLVGDVIAALVGWSPAPVIAAHPLELELVRIMDDPDGETVHGVVQVSALVEASGA